MAYVGPYSVSEHGHTIPDGSAQDNLKKIFKQNEHMLGDFFCFFLVFSSFLS